MKLRLSAVLVLSLASSAFAVPTSAPPLDELAVASAKEVPAFVLSGTAEEPVEAPKPSPLGELAKQFLTPTSIASVVVTVLGLLGGALGLSALRKRQIAIVTQHAFNAVEDFSATTETTVDDKIAAGLRVANEWMVAQGWRPLRPGETAVVKLGFTALNGATKLAEKVAANAQVEATKALEARHPPVTAVPPTAG